MSASSNVRSAGGAGGVDGANVASTIRESGRREDGDKMEETGVRVRRSGAMEKK